MVPLTPRLLPVILSSLAHHVASIRTAANETNYNLYKVIQVRRALFSSFLARLTLDSHHLLDSYRISLLSPFHLTIRLLFPTPPPIRIYPSRHKANLSTLHPT